MRKWTPKSEFTRKTEWESAIFWTKIVSGMAKKCWLIKSGSGQRWLTAKWWWSMEKCDGQ